MIVFTLHSSNPNKRDITTIVNGLKSGKIVIFPTDTQYAMGCLMSNKAGIDRILQITGKVKKASKLSLICKDLKQVADHTLPYDNHVFKTMKRYLPGPYTFILNANNSVTKYFKHNKKEIGIRIPDVEIIREILQDLDEPMVSTSLPLPDQDENIFEDTTALEGLFGSSVDILVFIGALENNGESTVLDCTGQDIEIIREGKGEIF